VGFEPTFPVFERTKSLRVELGENNPTLSTVVRSAILLDKQITAGRNAISLTSQYEVGREHVCHATRHKIFIKKGAESILKYKGFMILEVPTNVKYARKRGTNSFQRSKPIYIPWI
jgi:hypothetical protein